MTTSTSTDTAPSSRNTSSIPSSSASSASSSVGVPVTRTTSKAARALARARREALYADRAARDRRIEDGTAAAIAGLAAHAKLTQAENKLMAEIGTTLNALAAEGLSRADIAQLTDLTDAQIRRYQAAADITSAPTQTGSPSGTAGASNGPADGDEPAFQSSAQSPTPGDGQ